MTRYAGEHRGHRLVEVPSPRGNATYRLPERHAASQISDCIRALSSEGWSRAEISNVTGIRYQHVRNVLEGPEPASGVLPQKGERGGGSITGIDEGSVGSMVAFRDLVEEARSNGAIEITRDGTTVARLVAA